MKPIQYFSLSIIVVVFLSALVYATYPLKYYENMAVLSTIGERGAPGFVCGLAGIGSVEGYIQIRGVVEAHGVIEAGGRDIPFMVVRSDGENYTVLLGSNLGNYLKKVYNDEVDIHVFPMYMMEHNVTITGIKTSVDNVVIATSISMTCMEPYHMPHEMPMEEHNGEEWHPGMPMMTCMHNP